MIDVEIKRASDWTFTTFGSGAVGALVMVAGGQVILGDPQHKEVSFTYGGIGAGASVGLRLPKIPKVKVSATGAPFAFPSTGAVFATTRCPGPDLTYEDFRGPCLFVDGGAGLIGGGSGTLMIAGCNPTVGEFLMGAVTNLLPMPGMAQLRTLMQAARAVIAMAGVNVGLQAGAGVAGYLGLLL